MNVILFFDSAQSIDLANANGLKLQTLIGACERAAFGLDNRDVLDETYRKAWKMDSSNFLTRLDVVSAGIIDHVCAKLMQGNTERRVRSEIYKLNVYGERDQNSRNIHEVKNLHPCRSRIVLQSAQGHSSQ